MAAPGDARGENFRVVPTPDAQVPYALLDPAGEPVEPVQDYLAELLACDRSPLTLESYAYDLQDWFRFLAAAGVGWEQATRGHVRDWVLAMRAKHNPQHDHRPDRPPPGSVNPRTGKPSLRPGYARVTINHRLSAVAGFYNDQRQRDRGPLVNPVPADRKDLPGASAEGRGGNAHHNPMEPWRPRPRRAYRQKTERRTPRAIPDDLYEEVFAALTSDRDRAIVSLLVSSAARAAELLGMAGEDVDWGGQRVRLISKGTHDAVWVSASPDFFRWLARYLTQRPAPEPGGPLWLTLRPPLQPLGYQALRAVLLRVNDKLGTNLVLHDFRHTCALRMAGDPTIPITYVQTHLRHKHLSTTTETYLVARDEDVIRRVQAHHQQQALQAQSPPAAGTVADDLAATAAWRYQQRDLDVLLGPGRSGTPDTTSEAPPGAAQGAVP